LGEHVVNYFPDYLPVLRPGVRVGEYPVQVGTAQFHALGDLAHGPAGVESHALILDGG
jgi:hypothetical protein